MELHTPQPGWPALCQPRRACGAGIGEFLGGGLPTCVAELPMLGAYARQHADWQVLLVNTDSAAAAQRFLESHALSDMALSDINALTLLRPGLNVSG